MMNKLATAGAVLAAAIVLSSQSSPGRAGAEPPPPSLHPAVFTGAATTTEATAWTESEIAFCFREVMSTAEWVAVVHIYTNTSRSHEGCQFDIERHLGRLGVCLRRRGWE
jgi:hypothetical protein